MIDIPYIYIERDEKRIRIEQKDNIKYQIEHTMPSFKQRSKQIWEKNSMEDRDKKKYIIIYRLILGKKPSERKRKRIRSYIYVTDWY